MPVCGAGTRWTLSIVPSLKRAAWASRRCRRVAAEGAPSLPRDFEEVRVLAEGVDRIDIALTQEQQFHLAGEHVSVRFGVVPCRRRLGGTRDRLCPLANRDPDKSQSRVRCEIHCRFRNNQPLHGFTCGVSLNTAVFLLNAVTY